MDQGKHAKSGAGGAEVGEAPLRANGWLWDGQEWVPDPEYMKATFGTVEPVQVAGSQAATREDLRGVGGLAVALAWCWV